MMFSSLWSSRLDTAVTSTTGDVTGSLVALVCAVKGYPQKMGLLLRLRLLGTTAQPGRLRRNFRPSDQREGPSA